MTKNILKVTYKSGAQETLYGYLVHGTPEQIIGIVTGDSKRGFDGYKVDEELNIVGHFGFRARKEAFEFVVS